MSSGQSDTDALVSWYSNNVAKPYTADEAYGYWAFVVGSIIAVVGFLCFLVSTSVEAGTSSFWLLRQVSFALIAIALPVILYGFIVVMPLGARATRVAFVGLAVSMLAVVAFLWAYPANWNVGTATDITDQSAWIVTLYAIGMAIQTISALLFPAATAGRLQERPPLAEAGAAENGDRSAPTGEAAEEETADGASLADDAETAEDGETADDADAIVLTHDETELLKERDSNAMFELYEDRAGESRWRLRHRNGNIIADGGQGFTTREGAEQSRDRVKRYAADADTLEYTPAGFEVYRDRGDEWRWRLRHKNGRILAHSGEGYSSRRNARSGIESTLNTLETDPEVYEDKAGQWRWRLRHKNGNIVAASRQGYTSERGATRGFESVRDYAPEADTLDYDPVAFEVYQDRSSKYRWRLRHRNGQIIASGSQGYSSRQKARQGLKSVRTNAPDAPSRDLSEEQPAA